MMTMKKNVVLLLDEFINMIHIIFKKKRRPVTTVEFVFEYKTISLGLKLSINRIRVMSKND